MLRRLGLDRRDLRAWAMYDFANSAFQTTIVSGIFPIYFQKVASVGLSSAEATSRFSYSSSIAILIVAIVAPLLGALADQRPVKKVLLTVFMTLGVVSTIAMYWIQEGDWSLALTLFVIGNVAVAGSIVFYESLLPYIAGPENMDRVSTAGYAIGYVGGGLLIAVNLVMIQQPAWFGIPDAGVATRLSFVSVGLWWLAFSVPLLRHVPEPRLATAGTPRTFSQSVGDSFKQLGHTFKVLRQYRQALLMLLAFFLYNDGIQTMIRMATTFGTELGFDSGSLITALVLVQFVGIPCTFAFGAVASKLGAKVSIFIGLAAYLVITVFAYRMTAVWEFYVLAGSVGVVQGGTQALSRSLFASMIPKERSSEFFAFFSVFERYAGVLGPAIFGWVVASSGSSRNAILSLIFFFISGMLLLSRVDVKAGQRAVAGPS